MKFFPVKEEEETACFYPEGNTQTFYKGKFIVNGSWLIVPDAEQCVAQYFVHC